MDIRLKKSGTQGSHAIAISGSKSETNRLLLLQSLFPEIKLQNISGSDDSNAMSKALESRSDLIDVGHAGTAMRFLTAYFAIQTNRAVTLTGSERMQQRPIGILVDALRMLGAQIDYLKNDGFPPLKIVGKGLNGRSVSIGADVSSQYISAMLLIAPKLENGLELTLEGEITSRPYIEMGLALLNEIGVKTSFEDNIISVQPAMSVVNCTLSIESDWSSASYFYSIVALSEISTQITLSTFKQNSFQGDSALAGIYKIFGVDTYFEKGKIRIVKTRNCQLSTVNCQLNKTPDLAQTIAVTCIGLGIKCQLTGLHTLKIKETDRILALKTELEKLGATVSVTDESLEMVPPAKIQPDVSIATYNDHRMAMAFAPLAVKVPITIENAEVVSKSYPGFWDHLESIGFESDRSKPS